MIFRRQFLSTALGGLFFGGLIFLSLIEPNIQRLDKKPENRPDLMFEGATFWQYEQGRLNWEIRAKNAAVEYDVSRMDLTQINATMYDKNEPVVDLKAPTGSVDIQDAVVNMVDAQANLETEGSPISLWANDVRWYAETRQLTASDDVKILSDGLTLTGDYFRVDVPVQKVYLSQNTKAVLSGFDLQ